MSATLRPGRYAARSRGHPAYWAFVVHRVSGLALTLFLPVHFWVLAHALRGEAEFGALLRWTASPAVKAGETLLVLALATHLAGGVRLLLVEFRGWRGEGGKTRFALVAGVALACALLFAFNAVSP